MTFAIVDVADSAGLSDTGRLGGFLAASAALERRLANAGIPAVPAGGPYHPRERIADDAALGRRLLHAAIAAGASLPLFHILGAPDGSLIDGLVRYLDAVVDPPPPVVLLVGGDGPSDAFAAALRAREALSARGRSATFLVATESDDGWLDTLRRGLHARGVVVAAMRETLPLRRHVHVRWVEAEPDSAARWLDPSALLETFGITCVTRSTTEIRRRASSHPDAANATSAGRRLLLAKAALVEARNVGAGSVTFPRGLASDELDAWASVFTSAEDRIPFGTDGDDLEAFGALLVQRATTDLRPLGFHAVGRRGTALAPTYLGIEGLLAPADAVHTLVRVSKTPTGLLIALRVRGPGAPPFSPADWPSDRALRVEGDRSAELSREGLELGIPVRLY